MDKNIYLMTGPTVMPDRVLRVMGQQVVSHRGKAFGELGIKVGENLKQILQTKNDVLTLTSSGTGAMEAAVQNCFKPGDEVIVAVLGTFSERMAKICETYGLKVTRIVAPSGEPVLPAQVMEVLTPETKGVFVVHNESETGVRSDLKAFGDAIYETNALLVVDSVSALGGMEMQMDAWHVDVVFASSQKALMAPAGLAVIALSDRAWERVEANEPASFYFDLRAARKIHQIGQHPWTPGINCVLALYEATSMILEEGVQNVWDRHIKLSNMVIDGMEKLGVHLYPKDRSYASITVNTFALENSPAFVSRMAEEGVIISGGQDSLNKTTFRVGTMGYVSESDVAGFLCVAERVLKELK